MAKEIRRKRQNRYTPNLVEGVQFDVGVRHLCRGKSVVGYGMDGNLYRETHCARHGP
jgi:hypothetical protein